MKQYKPREKFYRINIEVEYVPFPSEKARIEAYHTHAKLFLRAQERMLKETQGKYSKISNKEGS